MIAGKHTGAALAKRERLIAVALRMPKHDEDQSADQHYGQKRQQQIKSNTRQRTWLFKTPLDSLDLLRGHTELDELFLRGGFGAFVCRRFVIIIKGNDNLIAGDFQVLDVARLDITHQVSKTNFLYTLACVAQTDKNNENDEANAGIDKDCFQPGIAHRILRRSLHLVVRFIKILSYLHPRVYTS